MPSIPLLHPYSKRPVSKIKTLCAIVVLSMTCHVPNANANVFDTLLDILMPSYRENKANDDEATTDDADTDASVGADTSDTGGSDAIVDANSNPQVDSSVPVISHPNQLDTIDAGDNLTTAPLTPSLYTLLEAEFALDRGDVNRGLFLYKQESFSDNAATVFERALSLSMDYEPVSDSLTFTQAWQQKNPAHLPAQFYAAHLALKAHDYTLASDVITQILLYDSNADLSSILEGIFPETVSDQQELLSALRNLPQHENASLLTMQAGLLYQLGQYELALVNVNRALDVKPDNIPYITLKADVLQKLQPSTSVIDFVDTERERLADRDGAKSLYLYEIRYRLSLGQTEPAWDLLLLTHQRFSTDTEITLLAALVSIDIGEFTTADRLLGTLASLPSYLDQSYYYLGISAERQNNYPQAERYLSKVMREDLVWEARKKVVAIKLLNGDADGAIHTLQQLSEQFSIYAPESIVLQAEILRQQDKVSEAKQLLADASERYPDDLDILYARSQLLNNRINSEYTTKRGLLERLILLNPENTDYQVSYAQMLFEDPRDRAEGLIIAQAVVDIPYNDARFDSSNYIASLNLLATDALANQDYNKVLSYLRTPYDVLPTLESGVLLLRAYQGLEDTVNVNWLFSDLQDKFALGQSDITNHLQTY